MLIIDDTSAMARALEGPIDPNLKRLLTLRRAQLLGGGGHGADGMSFVIVQPGDGLATIATATGFPIDEDTPFEWVLDHGGWFEAPIILSDEGDATILIVPDAPGIAPTLLALLRDQATSPTTITDDTTDALARNG